MKRTQSLLVKITVQQKGNPNHVIQAFARADFRERDISWCKLRHKFPPPAAVSSVTVEMCQLTQVFPSSSLKEEEHEESGDLANSTTLHHPLLPSNSQCEEDPQAILDEHLSRVLKTPGCQSPGVARHSPRSHSPDRTGVSSGNGSFYSAYPGTNKALMTARQSTKHIHHYYIHHHHAGAKTKEQIEAEAAQRVQCLCPPGGANYSDYTPA